MTASAGKLIVIRVKNQHRRELRDSIPLTDFAMPVSIDLHADKTISQGDNGGVGERLLAKGR